MNITETRKYEQYRNFRMKKYFNSLTKMSAEFREHAENFQKN